MSVWDCQFKSFVVLGKSLPNLMCIASCYSRNYTIKCSVTMEVLLEIRDCFAATQGTQFRLRCCAGCQMSMNF